MNAQLKETHEMTEFSEMLNRRNELIDQFRKTKDADYAERVKICMELAPMFERRVDWQRKHHRSYTWAMARGVVPRVNSKGFKNGKPALFSRASDLARVAKARDQLHDFCCLKQYPYEREHFAGEVFKQQVQAGNSIESSLECAKQALLTGMAE